MAYIPPSEFSVSRQSSRNCASCGYDLRGLPLKSSCPECGEDPRSQAKSQSSIEKDIPLSQMHPTFIRRFALCCLASSFVFPAIISRMFVPYMKFENGSISLSADFCIASIWIVGVYILTSPLNHPLAIRYGLGKKGILRRTARWCSFAGVGVVILAHAPPSLFTSICFAATIIVSGVGLISLFLLLSEISVWVRDTTAKKYLETAAWGVPALTLISQLGSLLSASPLIVSLIFGLGIVLLLGGVAGMMMLTSSVIRAIAHARDYEEYQGRRLQSKESTHFPKPE